MGHGLLDNGYEMDSAYDPPREDEGVGYDVQIRPGENAGLTDPGYRGDEGVGVDVQNRTTVGGGYSTTPSPSVDIPAGQPYTNEAYSAAVQQSVAPTVTALQPGSSSLVEAEKNAPSEIRSLVKKLWSPFGDGKENREDNAAYRSILGTFIAGFMAAPANKKTADANAALADAKTREVEHKINAYNNSQLSKTSFGKAPPAGLIYRPDVDGGHQDRRKRNTVRM